MKLRLMVASAFGLLVMVGFADAQNTPEVAQPAPQQNVATQTDSSPGTGMEAYGGTPDTRVQSGAKRARPCRVDPQCNVFFGGS
ncbi:hypothetical protein P0D69_05825 [Paraburkholderia sediminicola]|uniref:hypothetical protein n=1 Tax=Paraburkholderia sediminicola TaxID=458836 RepID=UPI0038BCCAA9